MSDSDEQKQRAQQLVRGLFRTRLRNAGLPDRPQEKYFHCEAEDPENCNGGTQVRVRTWRHWSDARTEYDRERSDTERWAVDRLASPKAQAELTQKQARDVVTKEAAIPDDATVTAFHHYELAPETKVAFICFARFVDGLRVDGDTLEVRIHSETLQVVDFFRKWRELRLDSPKK